MSLDKNIDKYPDVRKRMLAFRTLDDLEEDKKKRCRGKEEEENGEG
jgi:hypothetical protein